MALDTVLQKAVLTCFKTFKAFIVTGAYSFVADNELDTSSNYDMTFEMLILSASYIDVTKLSFYHLIQPEDKIGLVQGVEVTSPLRNGGKITDPDEVVYNVESVDVAPGKVLYTILLRG